MSPSGAISAWTPSTSASPSTTGAVSTRPSSTAPGAGRSGTGSDLNPAGDGPGDLGDRVNDRYAVLLLPASIPERDCARRHVVVAGQQHVGDLLALCVADLLLHPVIAGVDLNPDTVLAQPGRDSLQVIHVRIGDRDADNLHRRQPGRERASVVLGEDAKEPLDRAEQGPVDHVWPLPAAVRRLVLDTEPA